MGVFDYLGDEGKIQVKCFDREMRTYRLGDSVPRKGTYSIALVEGGWANVKESVLTSFTEHPWYEDRIDKWGATWEPDAYGKNHPFRPENLLAAFKHPSE